MTSALENVIIVFYAEGYVARTPNNLHKKGGDHRYKWVQVLVSPNVHKRLRQIALDRDITLKELLGDIIEDYLNKER